MSLVIVVFHELSLPASLAFLPVQPANFQPVAGSAVMVTAVPSAIFSRFGEIVTVPPMDCVRVAL